MAITQDILTGISTVLESIDGIDRVQIDWADIGINNYEDDSARIRMIGTPDITEEIGMWTQNHTVEVVILKGDLTDREEKFKLLRGVIDEAIEVLESRSHATLGGVVDNARVDPDSSAIGEIALGNKQNMVAGQFMVKTTRRVDYRD